MALNGSARLPNPKQNGVPHIGRFTWFPYYAGFSPVFVEAVFDALSCGSTSTVCDPWNGAGTTTQAAFDRGIPSFGFDLNPAMTRVALARTTRPADTIHLMQQHREVVANAKRFRSRSEFLADPLANWFGDTLVRSIRFLSRALHDPSLPDRNRALFEAAVFRTLHTLSTGFRSSNPTWMRHASYPSERVEKTQCEFFEEYDTQVRYMIEGLNAEARVSNHLGAKSQISTASSTKLPLPDCSIRLAVGSPPYCTRIDYAVTTSVELAYLGIDVHGNDRSFRHQMTGTSTIRKSTPLMRTEWGETCNRFLQAVKNHPSKASESYYLKTHLQYFNDLFLSLQEIRRVLEPGGDGILVIQDSFYKEVHNDLPCIVEEMVTNVGMSVVQREDFAVSLDIGRLNPRANRKRLEKKPVESVVHFKRVGKS